MQVVQALDNIADSPLADKIAAANQQALERIIQSHPVLIGFDQAINVVPGMTAKPFFTPGHRSPGKMCGAMKGAVTGALVFEGLAKDLDEAAELAASGRSPSRRATNTTVWDRWRASPRPRCLCTS